MMEYKGYTIEKVKNVYWVYDENGNFEMKTTKLAKIQKHIDEKTK